MHLLHRRLIPLLCCLFLLAGAALCADPAAAQSSSAAPAGAYTVPHFALPDLVSICGQRVPLEEPDVYERVDMEFTIAVYAHAQVILWLKRANRYFPHIEKRLAEEGLPDDLKYLAVAESDLRPYVYSPARASGSWQFIKGTGVRYGLRHSRDFDDRLNFELATEAALKYLKRLYREFGSWTLAMAAYNCGEGRVAKEIRQQGTRDYFDLNLPWETERYVPRIVAIKVILDNPEKYGYRVDPRRLYQPKEVDKVAINLAQDLHFGDAARALGTTYKKLRELNPEIRGRHFPAGRYTVAVPPGLGPRMKAYVAGLKQAAPSAAAPSAGGKYYKVKRGDTLHKISARTGVPVNTLRRLNNIEGSHIWVGQKLKLSP